MLKMISKGGKRLTSQVSIRPDFCPCFFSGCCADAARGRGVGRGVCIPWRGCVRENGRLVTAASN